MQYSNTKIEVNGIWRDMLIVTCDTPYIWDDPRVIKQQTGVMEITYHTDGLFRAKDESGKYYYWFLLESISEAYLSEYVRALQTERDALADANSILTGGAAMTQPVQAQAYRAKIEAAVQFAPDEVAITEPSLYRRWTPDWTGKRGDIVRGDDGEGLYRAV